MNASPVDGGEGSGYISERDVPAIALFTVARTLALRPEVKRIEPCACAARATLVLMRLAVEPPPTVPFAE